MKLDVIIIGNSGAGKTSLVQQYKCINPTKRPGNDQNNQNQQQNNENFSHRYMPTVGIDLVKKDIVISSKQIKLCIWDTAGQEQYSSITSQYYQKADGVAIVFDITDKESFNKVREYWLEQVSEKSASGIKKILIGNKVDLNNRQVSFKEAQGLAETLQIKYFETSAKTQEQVQEAFDHLAKITLYSIESDEVEGIQFENQNQISITNNGVANGSKQSKMSKIKEFFKCF